MKNNFSKNLKSIREAKKISQQEIADKIGIDRSAISYWESGKADPTMGNVVKVAEALDVDIVTLIGGELNFDNTEIIAINDNLKIAIEKGTELTYEDIVTVQQKLAEELKKKN